MNRREFLQVSPLMVPEGASDNEYTLVEGHDGWVWCKHSDGALKAVFEGSDNV